MAKFQEGNSFWKSRSKHGRDKLFATPEELLQAACDYFDYCDSNPWKTVKKVESTQYNTIEEKPTQKPYSLGGFRHYVGASESWLREFKKTCSSDFLRVIEEIENYIATQQWEGATVGAFNANIIARTLGLSDKSDITTKGESLNSITAEQAREKAKKLDEEY
jgi:hypothetical protein